MTSQTIGFAMCGSFCTFSSIQPVLTQLVAAGYKIVPIMSQTAFETDTRFGSAQSINDAIEEICGSPIIHTIPGAEPIGPKKLLDALIIEPCTGNTLGKLANGISDTPVTLAAKAHLRNNRPIVVAVSTNDALSGSAQNIGKLLNTKNYYFVPMRQDDPINKPTSIVADFSKTLDTLTLALQGKQFQPILN